MPKEKFYPATAVEGDDTEATVTIGWGQETGVVTLNGVEFDRSGINRLIRAARKARDQTYDADN